MSFFTWFLIIMGVQMLMNGEVNIIAALFLAWLLESLFGSDESKSDDEDDDLIDDDDADEDDDTKTKKHTPTEADADAPAPQQQATHDVGTKPTSGSEGADAPVKKPAPAREKAKPRAANGGPMKEGRTAPKGGGSNPFGGSTRK